MKILIVEDDVIPANYLKKIFAVNGRALMSAMILLKTKLEML